MTVSTRTAQERAEASFKKKEKQLEEGQKARAEYEANSLAMREKTARLKALRLAHEAAGTAPSSSAGTPSKASGKGRR